MKKYPIEEFTYYLRSTVENIMNWTFYCKCPNWEHEEQLSDIVLEKINFILSDPMTTKIVADAIMERVHAKEYESFIRDEYSKK